MYRSSVDWFLEDEDKKQFVFHLWQGPVGPTTGDAAGAVRPPRSLLADTAEHRQWQTPAAECANSACVSPVAARNSRRSVL